MHPFQECPIKLFGDSIIFWSIVNGELVCCSLGLQVLIEGLAQVLPSSVRVQGFEHWNPKL